MELFSWFTLLLLLEVILLPCTHQLQTSQSQVLQQLRKYLEYPSALDSWENYNGDFCELSSSLHMSISCQDNSVTQLKIMGDKRGVVREFYGFAIPNQTLSERFSIDSFVTTLTRLPSLKVLSLVSLGIWGPLPDKIHRLSALEVLDLSSNFIFGSVPPKISRMVKLNSLTLDGNYFNDTALDWLDSLSNLTILSLKNNRFQGQFPHSVTRVTTLTDFSMSGNKLSGRLPDLSSLTTLRVLDLRDNHLDSELPLMPKGLVTVLLSKNTFSGDIPAHFGDLVQLQHLDMSFNSLSGVPPSALFSLPSISYLNLASNKLSGSLPDQLSCGGKLGFVDISSNRLRGGLPPCLASNSDNKVVKLYGNCLSIDSKHQHRGSYCREGIQEDKSSTGTVIAVLVAAISGGVVILVLLVVGVLFLCRRYRSRKTPKDQHTLPKQQDNPPSVVCSELITSASKLLIGPLFVGILFMSMWNL